MTRNNHLKYAIYRSIGKIMKLGEEVYPDTDEFDISVVMQ